MDQERVETIIQPILLAIRDNFVRGPTSRDRTLEALNALAASTAFILLGCGEDPQAKEFFLKALEQNIQDNRK